MSNEVMNPGGLNDGQMKGVYKIQSFLNSDDLIFTLTGGPGTGKTYMLSYVLRLLNKQDIYFAAPSHAAKSVLDTNLKNANISAKVLTVASLLGVKPVSFSERVFHTTGVTKDFPIDLLIIDECSMISDEYYKLLIAFAEKKQIKIVAVGDINQLPPVEQHNESLFFNHVKHRLTADQRFGKNIKSLATVYEQAIEHLRNDTEPVSPHLLNLKTGRKSIIADNEFDGNYIFTNDAKLCVEFAAKIIKESEFKGTACRLLAFKNETVNLINSKIRKYIFDKTEEELKQFEDNETVICNGGCEEAGLFNGQVLVIQHSETTYHPKHLNILCQRVILKNVKQPVYVVDTTGVEDFQLERDRMYNVSKKNNFWKDYWSFVDSFTVLDYGYAQNVYKCQGSSIDHVIIFEDEIMSIKPISLKAKLKSLYVAVTRTIKTVHIYNPNY